MFLRARLLAAVAVAALSLGSQVMTMAETPADTFVQAWTPDDIISLDPAEVFELSASEILGNSYEPIISYDLKDVSRIFGVVADTWTMSADGKTMSFTIRQGKKFASGNDMMADDVVFSLVRAVKLDKSPAFILDQFGLTPDNVETMVKQTGDDSFDFTMDKAYAPTFLLYCLTATVAMVVDKDLAKANEVDGDFGYSHPHFRDQDAAGSPDRHKQIAVVPAPVTPGGSFSFHLNAKILWPCQTCGAQNPL